MGSQGDLYDRMILMIAEIVESTVIITQVLFKSFILSYDGSNQKADVGTNLTLATEYVINMKKVKQFV